MHQVHPTCSIKIRFLLLLASIFSFGHAFPQANVVNDASDPKHETANQQVISVLFGAALTRSTSASDWSVFVDGNPVTTVSATVSGSRVLVQFDASIAPGHTSEKYVLPGEVLTISFTNSSTLSANSFASITSKNNLVFTCSEMIFFQQGSYDVVDFCSPVVMDFFQFQYYVSLRFRNSSLYNISDFRSNIQWGDAVIENNNPFFQSDASGASSTTFVSATGFSGNPAVVLTQQPTHNYPAANPTDCSFDIALTPYHMGSAVVCNSIATTKSIATYDNDNANSGALTLEPVVPLTNLICLGSNVNMRFSDDSQLNCRVAIEAILPNDQSRWIRIIYGSRDYAFGNIPDIRVNGVPVTLNDATGTLIYPTGYYPTGAGGIGVPDANGVIELATPVTVSTGITHMLTISTIDPTNQVIDQRFYVRVEYWNICNPYDAGNAVTLGDAVSIENYDIIIDSPPPPGFSPTVFCESLADNTYVVTALGTGAGTYNWYSTFPLVVAGDLEKTGSSFNPVTEATVPSVVAKSPLSATTTNFYLTETLVSGCVSLPAIVPFTIHKVVNPGTIQYSGTPICFGADPPIINSMTLATGGDGSTYTYQWEKSTDGFGTITIIGGATGTTYDPPVLTQTTSFRRVATSGVCTAMPSPAVTITVNPLPTGVVSGGGNACNDGTNSTSAPSIIFTFTGSSPFDFQYAINGVPQAIINNVSSPYILTPIIGTYTLVSLIDNNSCVATSLMGTASSVATGSSPPILEGFTSSSPVCDDGVATVAPSAIINLAGGSDNYDITFSINGNFYTQNLTSDVNGLIPLNPSYTIDWGGLPGSHSLDIITIKNTLTLCAGNTPFVGPSLVVNSRPATPTGPINSIACSNPDVGAPLNVTDPDPTTISGVDITWSTGGTTLASYNPVGIGTSGSNSQTFTPPTSATSTFYAFAINSVSGCISNNGIAVSQQQDLAPTGVTAGPDQLNLCTNSPSATMTASAPGLGETGTWTVPGEIVYFQNFSGFAIGTTTSGAVNGWTRNVSDPQSFNGGAETAASYFSVQGNRFEGHDTNAGAAVNNLADVIWISPIIDISGISGVQASVDLLNNGSNNLDAVNTDYVQVYYKLDNGVETNFNSNGLINGSGSGFSLPGATATATAFATAVTGATLQLFVKMSVNATNEKIAFDNVTIKKSSSTIVITNPNSNTTTVSNLPAPAPGNSPITTQFKWSVTSPLGVCAPTTSVVNLQVNPLPTSSIVTPVLCDASPGIPLEVPLVDLATYNASVTDATIVDWFSNSARITPVLAPLTVLHGTTFYWRATSATGCQNIGDITFTVRALPSAINQAIEICEDAVGSGSATGINLTSYEPTITNGESPRLLEWYEDDGFGGLGVPVGSLTSYSIASTVSVTRLLHLKVIDSSSPTVPPCFEIADVTLEYKIRPTDNLILDGLGNVVGPTFTICTSNSLVLLQVDPNQNPGSDYVWNIPPTFGEFEIVSNDNTFFIILRFPTAIPGTPPSTNYPSGLLITVTEMYGSCTGNTIGTTVIVESIPITPVVSGPPRVCVDGLATFTASPATTATYTWTFPSGVTILSADPTQSSINVKWGSTAGDVFVSYETPTGCVSASSAAYPVMAIDRPNILSANAISICNGQNVGTQYLLQSDILNTTYNWIVTGVTGSVSGAVINDQATDVTSINQTLTNTSSAPATVTYEITPIGPDPDNCAGPVHVLTVSLNVPVVNSGLDAEICSRDASGIVLSTDGISVGAGSYKLLAITVVPSTAFETSVTITSSSPVVAAGKLVPGSSNAIVGASGGIDFIRNDKFINTTSLPIIIRYEIIGISPAPASCPGPLEIIELTINPEPILDDTFKPDPDL